MKVFYQYKSHEEVLCYPNVNVRTLGIRYSIEKINGKILKHRMDTCKKIMYIRTERDPKETCEDIQTAINTNDGYYIAGEYHKRLPYACQWLIRNLPNGEPNIEAYYEEWKTVAPVLFKAGMQVNMYTLDRDVIFNSFNELVPETVKEKLKIPNAEEQYWIAQSLHSGYRYAEEGFSGEAHHYDFKSFYPYLQINCDFPCGKPKFVTLKEYDPKLYRFAIYRWNDYSYDGRKKCDVLKLADDGEPNALVWTESIAGRSIFGRYVGTVFPLKEAGYDIAKEYLNKLTGLLAMYNWVKTPPEDCYNICGDKYISSDSIFKHPQYAHLYSFICLFGRQMMSDIHKELGDSVKYVHTDGFLTTCKFDDSDINDGMSPNEIGYLRYEGSANYRVQSGRKIKIV